MILPDYVFKLFNDIAIREKITNYKIETDTISESNDGFFGTIIAIKLIGSKEINNKMENFTKNLICKLPPSEKRCDVYKTYFAFEREIEMYSKVFPLFEKFQNEKRLTVEDGFYNYPKVYFAVCDKINAQYVLIMDDLRQENYQMFPKGPHSNMDHITLIINVLAKFHAVSIALKDQRPEQFKQVIQTDVFLEMIKHGKMGSVVYETLDRGSRILSNEKHKRLAVYIRDNFLEILQQIEKNMGDSGVLTHGDLWNNNVMFQYKTNVIFKLLLMLIIYFKK